MDRKIEVIWWITLAGVAMLLGCASSRPAPEATQMVCPETVTRQQITQAAYDVLAGMHFPIEKLDAEQGIVRTRPLRGAQFFEFWRSDNVGAYNAAEANVQSIRRIVELRVTEQVPGQKPEAGDALIVQPAASGLCIECNVQVQRLALPGNEAAGVSQAYQIHTRSQSTLQTFEVTPGQRAGMAWIDLGPDPELAAEIVRRIEKKLAH